jgi:hypothetical protein
VAGEVRRGIHVLARSNSVFSSNLLAGDVLAGDISHSYIEQMNAYPMQKRESIATSVI